MKVFEITDDEYWFGETLDAVFAAILEETGMTREEYTDGDEPRELTEAELDTPNTVQLSEEGEPRKLGSYRDALELCMADGSTAGMLCGRE